MKISPRHREWNELQKREQAFIIEATERKTSVINRVLAEKVPPTLQSTLDSAFAKAFGIIFEKGTGIIEKTYDRAGAERRYKVHEYAADLHEDRKSLRGFSKRAHAVGSASLLISGAEGVGLGFFGIGLPDIPLFTGVLLRSVYEIALRYGYSYDSEAEKYFILKLIDTSLSGGDDLKRGNAEIDEFIDRRELPEGYRRDKQITAASTRLSGELLYMKFLQGVPIVGVVGGIYDAVYLDRVLSYAKLKYHRRFLLDRGRRLTAGNA